MARSNKYASFNFNDIYEKKIIKTHNNPTANKSTTSSSLNNPNKTILSNSRIHGHMLVLTRPTPKPITTPPPSPLPQPQTQSHTNPTIPDQPSTERDSISLRPQGRTGSGPSITSSPIQIKDKELPLSPKPDRFVPPHLRPGFVGREEKPGPEFQRPGPGVRTRGFGEHRQGIYGEDGRPKSGGGYETMRRGGESDLVEMNRPGSGGTRPSSSG